MGILFRILRLLGVLRALRRGRLPQRLLWRTMRDLLWWFGRRRRWW
jgi:hypothetical protein